METKVCSKCRLKQPIDRFSRDRTRKSGRHAYCKSCNNEYCREIRKKDKNYNKYAAKKMREYYKRLRLQALQKITGSEKPLCNRCSCDFLPLLNINHKNGGGRRERTQYGNTREFYRVIVRGTRKLIDLEVLCRVCNAIHYANFKYGAKYKVKFLGIDEKQKAG